MYQMASSPVRDVRGRFVAAGEPPFPDLWECPSDAGAFIASLALPGAACPPFVLLRPPPTSSSSPSPRGGAAESLGVPGVPPLVYAMRLLVDTNKVS